MDTLAVRRYLTLQAARCVGPGGRVYAFEPHPALVATLRENVARNGFGDRVTVCEQALSHASGPAQFVVRGAADMSSLYPGRPGTAVAVRAVRGDDILGSAVRPSVIKLDLEGGELDALRGLTGTLAAAGTDVTLFVEPNPKTLAEAGATGDELLDWLRSEGFEMLTIDEEQRELRPLEPPPLTGWVNVVCRRAAREDAS